MSLSASPNAPPDHDLSPRILTPEDFHSPSIEPYTFPRQPVASFRPKSELTTGVTSTYISGNGTESENNYSDDPLSFSSISEGHGQGTALHPVSLLTALLNSPDHQLPSNKSNQPGPTGIISARSSAPSTAFSSPSNHGILQQQQAKPAGPAASILRRSSASSDTGETVGLGVAGLDGVAQHLEKVEEQRQTIGWVDAIGRTESAPPNTRNPQTAVMPHKSHLKFAIAPRQSSPKAHSLSESGGSLRRISYQAQSADESEDEDVDEADEIDDEEEDEPLYGFPRAARHVSTVNGEDSEELDIDGSDGEHSNGEEDEDGDSDLGYEEDEEDGFTSEDPDADTFSRPLPVPETVGAHFAFARPTNYRRRHNKSPYTSVASPPSAAAIQPPPPRRGRGHIRVVDTASTSDRGCSRHCSPPPRKSRSTSHEAPPAASSPSARNVRRLERSASPNRLSEAGPRNRRAGSPMPDRRFLPDEDDDDEEEEENDVQVSNTVNAPSHVKSGWRSDDAVFFGPNSQRKHRLSLSQQSVFDGSDLEIPTSVPMEHQLSTMGGGVKDMLRRASEHIPGFRRLSSSKEPPQSGASSRLPATISTVPLSVPMLTQSTCPPAIDHTPATAASPIFRDGAGIAYRLERTLGQPEATIARMPEGAHLTRARSLGGRVSFPPNSDLPRRAVESPNKTVKTKPMNCPPANGNGDDLGWTQEAKLAIRRSRGLDES